MSKVDPYGIIPAGVKLVVIGYGSPLTLGINCYAANADSFHVGDRVVCTGTYTSAPPNQWITATSLTLQGASPSPSPSTAPSPTVQPSLSPSPTPAPSTRPFSQVILVMMENHPKAALLGNSAAPYLNNTLIPQSLFFPNYYAITNPSLPNYNALYAGTTNGLSGDGCPQGPFSGPTINSELRAAGFTFNTLSEEIPSNGSTACSGGNIDADGYPEYQGHHNAPLYHGEQSVELGFTSGSPPASFPTIAYIIPDNCDNMHDSCGQSPEANGDQWLQANIPPLISYANANNSLVVVAWDEGTATDNNVIALFLGPMVIPGVDYGSYNHYNLLRTFTNNFGLAPLNPAGAMPLN